MPDAIFSASHCNAVFPQHSGDMQVCSLDYGEMDGQTAVACGVRGEAEREGREEGGGRREEGEGSERPMRSHLILPPPY